MYAPASRAGRSRGGDPLAVVLAFSPDSQTLATANRYVQLWSAKTGSHLSGPLGVIPDDAKTIAFRPDGKGFFVATARWLNSYSWDGQEGRPLSSQMLSGFWNGAFHFSSDCEDCLKVALETTNNSFHLKTLHLDAPTDPPAAAGQAAPAPRTG